MASLEAIRYSRGRLELLDQRLLPSQTVFLPVSGCDDAHKLIVEMAVRGAPAIAVAGALALAVELHNGGAGSQFGSVTEASSTIKDRLDYLVSSRPTAVNMLDAAKKLKHLVDQAAQAPGADAASVVAAVVGYAEDMMAADVAANRAIGAFGMEAMLDAARAAGRGIDGKLRVLTHCNTGSLATAAYGTALGCIRALFEAGKLEHAFCTETRPYNQGARLTAYELVAEGIPATLIVDSAAAALMVLGRVDAVVVGADRVAANGDTANKVGTCMLSLAAAAAGVPFFVAAPTTSIDCDCASGEAIEIEQRAATELTHCPRQKELRVVAEGINVWNPAFDIACAEHITGIITEKGCVPKTGSSFDMAAFFAQHGLFRSDAAGNGSTAPPAAVLRPGFVALSCDLVKAYVASRDELCSRVGPRDSAASWTASEVGDGNINFVYVVSGPSGSIIVKQALPYVRCVGESWPLTQERLAFEAASLAEMHAHCPAHVPEVFLYDAASAVVAMQYLAPPCVILRHGILAGTCYPLVAAHLAELLACTLFRTSRLALDSAAFNRKAAQFGNPDMCALTEGVIFTDPYFASPNNRHTSPHLDAAAAALRSDVAAKAAIAECKALFCERRQALLHGDMHTGSVMASPDATYAIDSEFAFYGPMAFDLGKLTANFLLTYFALAGHSTPANPREAQQRWILVVVKEFWARFNERFLELWNTEGIDGCAYPAALYGEGAERGADALAEAQTRFMRTLFDESLMFAGACMVRRLVGIAHNADFETIEDVDVKAACELRALSLGRQLLVNRSEFSTVDAVVQRAVAIQTSPLS